MIENSGVPAVISEIIRRLDQNINSIEKKVDSLIQIDQERTVKWDDHIKEEQVIQSKVSVQESEMKSMKAMRGAIYTSIFALVLMLFGSIAYYNYGFGRVIGILEAKEILKPGMNPIVGVYSGKQG